MVAVGKQRTLLLVLYILHLFNLESSLNFDGGMEKKILNTIHAFRTLKVLTQSLIIVKNEKILETAGGLNGIEVEDGHVR